MQYLKVVKIYGGVLLLRPKAASAARRRLFTLLLAAAQRRRGLGGIEVEHSRKWVERLGEPI